MRRAVLAVVALAIAAAGFFAGRYAVPGRGPSAIPAASPGGGELAGDHLDSGATGGGESPREEPRTREERRRQRHDGGDRAARASRSAEAGATMPLEQAIREQAAGVWVEGSGTVSRMLRDDLRGRQHQRFVLALPQGGTLLVAHNTELAGRVPAGTGATLRFRGRYEWNRRGGVVHWTHRDPRGGAGGWLELDGTRYE